MARRLKKKKQRGQGGGPSLEATRTERRKLEAGASESPVTTAALEESSAASPSAGTTPRLRAVRFREWTKRVITKKRLTKAMLYLIAMALVPWVILIGIAFTMKLPPELATSVPTTHADGSHPLGVRIFDRDHHLLRDVRADDQRRADRKSLADFGEDLPRAVIAAEDRRFYWHPGIDPFALLRAFGSSIVSRRVVSGASTLTQQLARNVLGAHRSLAGKVEVMAMALRIEASLSKDQILEEYLNRVEFGPQIRGAEAAARYYFDKPAKELSLAEAASLAGIPRGPTVYDPRHGTTKLRRRRDRVLDRMASAGLASRERVDRAKNEPIVLATRFGTGGAPHFVRAVVAGNVDSCSAASPIPRDVVELTSTLDIGLEKEITESARATIHGLDKSHVTAASVVVLDNSTGDILAYVGSPDIDDEARLGQNDGVRALRQPGSSLKPFIYELGIERLGMSPATRLPDLDMTFATADGGDYRPQNYDEHFHGPVLLRDALGNSFNVPAVWTTERLGVATFLERLRALGFCSVTDSASHYGLGVALGDAEVDLLSLTNAYATLARGGLALPARSIIESKRWDGTVNRVEAVAGARVLDERAAYLITDVLSDRKARLASFGEGSVLELPFAVAAKTGTSKGYRDNITVGYTPAVTVGVWVGNFDGSPMSGVSGVTGAGPLFRDAMLAASRRRAPTPFVAPEGIESFDACPLSGKHRGVDCPSGRQEKRLSGKVDTIAGDGDCDMHVRLPIERESGRVAGPSCPPNLVEPRIFEEYPSLFAEWAVAAGRPLIPRGDSPRCPGGSKLDGVTGANGLSTGAITYPEDGAHFYIDDAASSNSAIRIRARVPPHSRGVRVLVDNQPIPFQSGGVEWMLIRGSHVVRVTVDGVSSDEVHFQVD